MSSSKYYQLSTRKAFLSCTLFHISIVEAVLALHAKESWVTLGLSMGALVLIVWAAVHFNESMRLRWLGHQERKWERRNTFHVTLPVLTVSKI